MEERYGRHRWVIRNAYIQDADLVMSNATMELNTSRYSAKSSNGDFIQTLVPDIRLISCV